ncbi:hypothetical protein [Nocardia sp. NRRL S-836]|uniref:hypothetical protein n=1 Tax=Nocardia sp. NRRL S-836 TaxID=1519492 RepID=UPI000A685F42|nr:hypothetical protein [Nocardia sp. NRRL S-836]
MFDAHRDDPEFGHRFLADEARDAGLSMTDRTAWRICSAMGWWSAFSRKRGRIGKKTGPPVHDDLVPRDGELLRVCVTTAVTHSCSSPLQDLPVQDAHASQFLTLRGQ